MTKKYRNICFTWNNPPEDGIEQLASRFPTRSYMVVGREVGDSGTPHLQGYVEFKNPAKASTLKRSFPAIHFEKRMGTCGQAADYCKKEDTEAYEEGKISSQGQRSDLTAVAKAIVDEGASFRDIAAEFPSNNAHRTALTLLTYYERPRKFKPEVFWLYGAAGVGKSRMAQEIAHTLTGDMTDVYTITETAKWWDGYDNHKVVILDEISSDFCSWKRILTLLDRYECRVEVKGGYRQLRSRYMIVTSSYAPQECWDTQEDTNQLMRRIDVIAEILCYSNCEYRKGHALPQLTAIPQDDETSSDEEVESTESNETVRAQNDA